jgi:hypothetical protein
MIVINLIVDSKAPRLTSRSGFSIEAEYDDVDEELVLMVLVRDWERGELIYLNVWKANCTAILA